MFCFDVVTFSCALLSYHTVIYQKLLIPAPPAVLNDFIRDASTIFVSFVSAQGFVFKTEYTIVTYG